MNAFDRNGVPDNLTTWLELEALKGGTDNQRDRWAHQLLPEDELTALARAELFSGFSDLKRWKNISELEADNAINHADACYDDGPTIKFGTEPAEFMTHDEWESYKLIQTAIDHVTNSHPWCLNADVTFKFATRRHVATCQVCKKAVRFSTALVTAQWAGRTLSREYSL